MSDEGGMSTSTDVTSPRPTVGECPEEDIAIAAYVPEGVGSGRIADRRQRGQFPDMWVRAGGYE
jgi:hypothetical protein